MRLTRQQLRRMIIEQAAGTKPAAAKAGPLKAAYDLLMKAGNGFGRKGQGNEFAEDMGSLLLSLLELSSDDESSKKLVAEMARKVEQATQDVGTVDK